MNGPKIQRHLFKAMSLRVIVFKSRFLRTPQYSVYLLTAEKSKRTYS